MQELPDVESNYAYFPVLVDQDAYGLSRDELHNALRNLNIHTRKYFYPLCSHYPFYQHLPSTTPSHLRIAEHIVGEILCLPIYGLLAPEAVEQICEALVALGSHKALVAGQ